MSTAIDANRLNQFVGDKWDAEIVPRLVEYIAIPNKSPMFDADWVANGYMEQAVTLMESWAKAQDIPGMSVEVVRLEGRTPLPRTSSPANGMRRSCRAWSNTSPSPTSRRCSMPTGWPMDTWSRPSC